MMGCDLSLKVETSHWLRPDRGSKPTCAAPNYRRRYEYFPSVCSRSSALLLLSHIICELLFAAEEGGAGEEEEAGGGGAAAEDEG